MAESDLKLRRLLSGLLDLERVGPHLRIAGRRALASGSRRRMVRVGRVLAGELLRRGELVRLAVESGGTNGGPLVLQHGSTRLIDLAPLRLRPLSTGEYFGKPAERPSPTVAPVIATDDGEDVDRVAELADLLTAMETAQNLDIGDPESGNKVVILDGIVALLERLMPQVHLFILLPGEDISRADHGHLLTVGTDAQVMPRHWLGQRERGTAVWIASRQELPGEIIRALAAKGTETDVTTDATGAFDAVAVPVREPDWQRGGDAMLPGEAGLLFVITNRRWGRAPLLRLAHRLASFVTRRWRRQREVNRRIHTDSLTGVNNRAFFDSQFPIELERAKRQQSPLTLVLGDLDRFKRINDNFGHQAGDLMLRQVAQRLQDELRRIDHVCRIGGEEFALILPHTSEAAAREVMSRLLAQEISVRLAVADGHRGVAVTVSYGAVTYPDAGADAFELYRKADDLLYASKTAGRNRCYFWNANDEHTALLGTRVQI